MGLFSRPVYEEMMLPFQFSQTDEDAEAGVFGITAYGHVSGKQKYCYTAYIMKEPVMYENGDYEQIINMLKNNLNKKVKVVFKIKNGTIKDFKIDPESLVSQYQNNKFCNIERIGWGMHDHMI